MSTSLRVEFITRLNGPICGLNSDCIDFTIDSSHPYATTPPLVIRTIVMSREPRLGRQITDVLPSLVWSRGCAGRRLILRTRYSLFFKGPKVECLLLEPARTNLTFQLNSWEALPLRVPSAVLHAVATRVSSGLIFVVLAIYLGVEQHAGLFFT